MKRFFINITFALLIIAFGTGCKDTELGTPSASTIADFTYTATNNSVAPCEVHFTNTSLNAIGYLWELENGQTSTEANPVAFFETPGFYNVKLTCTPVNDGLYYNQLVKTQVINIKDPTGGKMQVLYFTSRGAEGGNGHLVILNDELPVVQNFVKTDMERPYGIAADTANNKVYITDYSVGAIYRFDADGKNPQKILDVNVAGQEMVGDPQGIFVLGDKIYWGRSGGIYKANLDGSNPEPHIVSTAIEYPLDMQYDPTTNKIYLVNDKLDFSGGYFSVNLDGSDITNIIPDIDGTAIEVNFETNTTYLAVYGVDGTAVTENGIYSSKLDGTGLGMIGEFGSKATWGMAIDLTNSKLFWSYKVSNSNPDGKIVRANLDGSAPEDFVTGVSPHAMQIVWIKL